MFDLYRQISFNNVKSHPPPPPPPFPAFSGTGNLKLKIAPSTDRRESGVSGVFIRFFGNYNFVKYGIAVLFSSVDGIVRCLSFP